MGASTNFGFRWPELVDGADVPLRVRNLAEDIDGFLFGKTPVDDGVAGEIAIVQSTGAAAYKAIHGEVTVDEDGVAVIPPDTVTTGHLKDQAVTSAKLDDASVTLSKLTAAIAASLLPAGAILATARAAASTGFLLCDGASKLRADWPDLFAAIGTAYGGVDGAHFNVPDLRGRIPVGEDGAAGRLSANDVRGQSAGEEKHVLTGAEIPLTTHNNDAWRGTLDLTNNYVQGQAAQGHNNMQPYLIINYMIKT